MAKNKTGTIVLVGAAAAAGYLIYKSMSASAAEDSGMPQGSLGGNDSLLGDQGFNIDPNSAYPVPVYSPENQTQVPNTPTDQVPANQTPSGNDTYTSPDGSTASAGSGTDWANLALQAAIFGAGSYAAERGAKSVYDKWKSAKQLKAEEELKARGKTATEAERLSVEEQLKPEAKLREDLPVELKSGESKIDTLPKAERLKAGKEFRLSSDKVEAKFGEGKFGKAAGSAAEILVLAQAGSSIVESAKERAAKGESFWGRGNVIDRIAGSSGEQPVPVEGLGKFGEGLVNFATGLVYSPKWLNKYGYEDLEDMPQGWFSTEKSLIGGVKQIGASENVAQGVYNTASFLGVSGFLPSSWSGSSSSGSSSSAVTTLTTQQKAAQTQLLSSMGISTSNPFTSQATYDVATGTYTSSSGVKMSMASAPAGAAVINSVTNQSIAPSSSGSSSKSSSSSSSNALYAALGISTPTNPFSSGGSSSSSSSKSSSSQNMSASPKSTAPATTVSNNASASKAAASQPQTAPKTTSVVSNVVNAAKSAVNNVVKSIGSIFGGGKKK